ncbi:hypothetical protein [Lentzea sp. E54]
MRDALPDRGAAGAGQVVRTALSFEPGVAGRRLAGSCRVRSEGAA